MERFLARCHRRRYSAKSNIIYMGDKSESLYFLVSGSMSVLIEGEDGKEMIIAYLNQGEFFGEMGLFGEEESRRSAWVRAKSTCEVAEISYTKFHEISAEHPEIVFAIEQQMARRLRAITRKAMDLAFLDVTGRIAHMLLEFARQSGANIHPEGMQINVSRQEIAMSVGCSREMVTRVLKVMEERGIVSITGRSILIRNARSTRNQSTAESQLADYL